VGLDMLKRGEKFGESPQKKRSYRLCIVIKLLRKKGIDALTRITDLLTVAIAVQFDHTGLSAWIPTLSL
jgi:hypothetical protein